MTALLLSQVAPPPVSAEQEVVVIARNLERFRASVAFDQAGPHCRIAVSSGDPGADAVGCDAITVCYPAMEARRASINPAMKAGARRRMQAAIDRELRACFGRETKAGIAALAAKRASGSVQ